MYTYATPHIFLWENMAMGLYNTTIPLGVEKISPLRSNGE